MQRGKLNIIIDGQWGSTGKGKLAEFLMGDVDVSICNFGPNAGHTAVLEGGEKHVLQQLPIAVLNPNCLLLMSPACVISLPKLQEEIDKYKCQGRLFIHPNAAIVTQQALTYEVENLGRISSTKKGVGATIGMKISRHPATVLAKDVPELASFMRDTTHHLRLMMKSKAMCMAESAQGFDLSVNHGTQYPYVTSRDVTTAQILNDCGVPPGEVGDVYGCLRTYPIRVGDELKGGEKVGTSGPYHTDQSEVTWEYVRRNSGAESSQVELTTVTKKVRRVFTFSPVQMRRFLDVCAPTHIFLNFINHIDARDYGKRAYNELSMDSRDFIGFVGSFGVQVEYVGTGPEHSQMVRL